MVSKSPKTIDYRPLLSRIADALEDNNLIQLEGMLYMANNFSGLNAAIEAVAAGIEEVAAAIANPATLPTSDDQPAIDAMTARLSGLVDALRAAKVAEDAEDAVVPATEPTDGTGSGTTDEQP